MTKNKLVLLSLTAIIAFSCAFRPQSAAAAPAKAIADKAANKLKLPPNYAAGTQAYQLHHYNEAIACFKVAATQENCGANAWLYMAHCYYAQSQWKDALETYKLITEAYPNTPSARVAAQYLAALKASGKGAAASDNSSKSRSGPNSENKNNNDGDDGETTETTGTALAERIQVIRPRITHPPVTANLVRQVRSWINELPPAIKVILEKNNINFVITSTMIDAVPEGEYQEVKGYEGGTSKSCPGMFKGRTVYLAEHIVNEGSNDVEPSIEMSRIEDTFKHETGHAIDRCLGWISSTEEYKHGYRLDTAHVPDNVASKIRYYLQMNERGWRESFAQLVAIKLGSQRDINSELAANLPLSLKFVGKVLGR